MEVRLEADAGFEMPDSCYVSVRVGDVQKQSKYCSKRIFKFPDRKLYGKVDIFQRIGNCELSFDPVSTDSRTARVATEDKSLSGLYLRYWGTEVGKEKADQTQVEAAAKKQSRIDVTDLAKKYLEEHQVDKLLQAAMRALLKARPESAQDFLRDYFGGGKSTEKPEEPPAEEAKKVEEPKQPVAPSAPKPDGQRPASGRNNKKSAEAEPSEATKDLVNSLDVKKKAQQDLLNALQCGALGKMLPPAERKKDATNGTVKEKAKRDLLKGLQSGALEKALPGKNTAQPHEDKRKLAREKLINGLNSGSLEAAFKDKPPAKASSSDAVPHAQDLKQWARDALESGVDTGTLESALNSTVGKPQQESDSSLKAKARAKLEEGLATGNLPLNLANALKEKRDYKNKDEKDKAKASLVQALESGALEKALAANKPGALSSTDVKQKAKRDLLNGLNSGALEKALPTNKPISQLKEKTKVALKVSLRSGALAKIFASRSVSQLKQKTDVKQKAKQDLLNGLTSGALEKALPANKPISQLKEKTKVAFKVSLRSGALAKIFASRSISQLKQKTQEGLRAASKDGTLGKRLVAARSQAAVSKDLKDKAKAGMVKGLYSGALEGALSASSKPGVAAAGQSSIILGMGNPLLDISDYVTEDKLKKYGLQSNGTILAEEKHLPLYKELAAQPNVKYIAGGATQNSIRVAQWMLQEPGATAYIGCVGDDDYAKKMRDACNADGVKALYMVDKSTPTGTCAVCITGDDRSLVANLGAANKYKASHLQEPVNWAVLSGAKVIYSAGFFVTVSPQSIKLAAMEAAKKGATYCLNLSAPFLMQVPPFKACFVEILPYVDFLFGNEDEAATWAETEGWETRDIAVIATRLSLIPSAKGKHRHVVITQGADSTIVAHEGHATVHHIVALPEDKIVDTNGAGDAYVGGFLAGLAKGKDIKACHEAGAYAASVIIQESGCNCPGKPSHKF